MAITVHIFTHIMIVYSAIGEKGCVSARVIAKGIRHNGSIIREGSRQIDIPATVSVGINMFNRMMIRFSTVGEKGHAVAQIMSRAVVVAPEIRSSTQVIGSSTLVSRSSGTN